MKLERFRAQLVFVLLVYVLVRFSGGGGLKGWQRWRSGVARGDGMNYKINLQQYGNQKEIIIAFAIRLMECIGNIEQTKSYEIYLVLTDKGFCLEFYIFLELSTKVMTIFASKIYFILLFYMIHRNKFYTKTFFFFSKNNKIPNPFS